MRAFVLGLVIGLACVPLGAYAYFKFGWAPVATSAPPIPFETFLARSALHARVFKEAPKEAPAPPDESRYLEAAKTYRRDCAVCHGLPDQPKTAIANGMFPKPPQLFHGKGVTDDPAGESYWKIRNGIRLTGMPGYQNALTDEQMWDVAALLANADKLPASVQGELKRPDPGFSAAVHGSPPPPGGAAQATIDKQ